jgi:hypothetical protein
MARKQKRTSARPKTVLRIQDLEQSKNAVLNSLASASSQESYGHAIEEWFPSNFDQFGRRRYGRSTCSCGSVEQHSSLFVLLRSWNQGHRNSIQPLEKRQSPQRGCRIGQRRVSTLLNGNTPSPKCLVRQTWLADAQLQHSIRYNCYLSLARKRRCVPSHRRTLGQIRTGESARLL